MAPNPPKAGIRLSIKINPKMTMLTQTKRVRLIWFPKVFKALVSSFAPKALESTLDPPTPIAIPIAPIKKETGKDAITHLKDAVNKEQDSQKFEKKIRNITKNTIDKVKRKLLIN